MARDEAVQSAIDNWAPRFVANGIDVNDFQRVTNSVERWDDWCQAWSECGAMHERMAEQAEAQSYYVSAGQHYFQAAISYHFGKYLFVQSPQELRTAHEHVVRDYQRALPHFDFPGERVAIPYEEGAVMYGVLRKPWHAPKAPVVIMVPGLDSVKEELHVYGDDFLRRGMAVLAIDGPGQGEMEFEYPMRYDYEVPITCTVNYLEGRSDIDASRIGMMGVSMGGYYVTRAAAFEHRIKATIENCGGYSLSDYFRTRPTISKRTMMHRLKAVDQADADERLKKFTLEGIVGQIQCPLLVIQGRRDRLVPAAQGERIAADAGDKAELWMFEDGNHVCNNIIYKHRPQQADWMREKLYA
jgi:dipeptidyl aminopeptidase/acylaminoacyl peptidase